MGEMLSGKGVWASTEDQALQAIRRAPLMGATHVMVKVGDTFKYQGVWTTSYYKYATSMRRKVVDAGLVPMAWIFMRMLHPEEEARLILRAFADGYQGVILDVEDQCDGKHAAARRLVNFALTHGVDPYSIYNCSFPNIDGHSGLPYETLNELCKGGLMPMAYAIFYRSDTGVPPAAQARQVIDDWTYAQYESFYGALSYKPPMYPVLGPFHEKPELRLLTAAEFQPWIDRLAAHEPSFFSIYAVHTIHSTLYPVIRDFRLGESGGGTIVITQHVWPAPLHGIVLRANPAGASCGGAPYGERLVALEKAQVAGRTWYRVRKADDVEGWIDAALVTTQPPDPYPDPGPEEGFPPGWLKYVWPVAHNVNLRRNTDATSSASLLGQVGQQTRLRLVDEEEQRTGRSRLGVFGAWFRVQVEPGGPEGYIPTCWVRAVPDLRVATARAEHYGINLSPDPPGPGRSPHRLPAPEELRGVGWVRFVFRDSALPDLTLEQSFAHYGGIVDRYRAAGVKTLLILNWESYWGHGPWDHGDWPGYVHEFADYVQAVAEHFAGRVAAYQIWNEGDNPDNPETSIYVSPQTYASILLGAGRAIKARDPQALVIFGGLCKSATANVEYVERTRAAMHGEWPVDAVAMHPYGQYPEGVHEIPHLTQWGILHEYLADATQGLPHVPIWITEIGVPIRDPSLADDQNYHWHDIAGYLKGVYAEIEQHYPERVPVVFWFAWSNKMEGAGIVDTRDNPRGPVYRAFFETVRGIV